AAQAGRRHQGLLARRGFLMTNDSEVLSDLLAKWEELAEAGNDILPAELCRDHPHLLPQLEEQIAKLAALGWMAAFQAAGGERPSGDVLRGYRLLGKLGRGGFGQVWKAAAPDDRLVALKVVECAEGGVAAELRVFDTLKALRHPNILTFLDAW